MVFVYVSALPTVASRGSDQSLITIVSISHYRLLVIPAMQRCFNPSNGALIIHFLAIIKDPCVSPISGSPVLSTVIENSE